MERDVVDLPHEERDQTDQSEDHEVADTESQLDADARDRPQIAPALAESQCSQRSFHRKIPLSSPHNASLSFRSEEHTSELQSLMRISYAVFCLKKNNKQQHQNN